MLGTPRQLKIPKTLIDIAPVDNAFNSMNSVGYARAYPGTPKWLAETREKLSEDELEKHLLLTTRVGLDTLINAVQEEIILPSFPAYLEIHRHWRNAKAQDTDGRQGTQSSAMPGQRQHGIYRTMGCQ